MAAFFSCFCTIEQGNLGKRPEIIKLEGTMRRLSFFFYNINADFFFSIIFFNKVGSNGINN